MKSYKCVTINGKQRRLHRHLMEQSIQRELLSSELVHHKDGDIHNNKLSNLEIVSRGGHIQTHNIGEASRYKQQYHTTKENFYHLFVTCGKSMRQMSVDIGISCGALQRLRIKYGIVRPKICCSACGEPAVYLSAELCNRHYQARWARENYARLKSNNR